MMRWHCSRESDTARAASVGEWPEGLRAHTADCSVCRDVALVAGALVDARRNLPAEPPVAGAGRIWWIAQLRSRRAAAERAVRPIAVMELVAIAAVVPVASGALASALPTISSWLAELRFVSAVAGIDGYSTLPGVSLAASAALAVLLLASTRAVTRADR
jgi:hypothetical protein